MGGQSSKDKLRGARRRASLRAGELQVSGRYHHLPRKLSDDYLLSETRIDLMPKQTTGVDTNLTMLHLVFVWIKIGKTTFLEPKIGTVTSINVMSATAAPGNGSGLGLFWQRLFGDQPATAQQPICCEEYQAVQQGNPQDIRNLQLPKWCWLFWCVFSSTQITYHDISLNQPGFFRRNGCCFEDLGSWSGSLSLGGSSPRLSTLRRVWGEAEAQF